MRRFAPLLLAGLFLTGCGYSPLYAPAVAGAGLAPVQLGPVAMTSVAIEPGQRLIAQEVRQRLAQSYPGAAGATLAVELTETTSALALERTATVRRAQIMVAATVQLLGDDGTVLETIPLSANVAYNVENKPFSTESGKSFARQMAARNLADAIARRVALWQRTAPQR